MSLADAPPITEMPEIAPVRKLNGLVAGVYVVPEGSVESVAAPALRLDFEGVVGDRHHGPTRKAGGREPWYQTGAAMSNARQVSIVSIEELDEMAKRLALDTLPAEWLGSNLVISGVPRLSFLPRGTRMFFAGGAALTITEQNGPCRIAGRAIVARVPGRPEIELEFPKVAKRIRGLVASVERPGAVAVGETVSLRLPEQWVYSG